RIEVGHGGRRAARVMPRRVLAEIILPRVAEMAGLVKAQLQRSGFAYRIPAGIVATGGAAGLRGLGDLFAERLGMAARVGMPEIPGSVAGTVSGPADATGGGLV